MPSLSRAHAHARAPTDSMYPMKKTVQAEARSPGRRIQVRRSGVHGRGVFALRPIAAGGGVLFGVLTAASFVGGQKLASKLAPGA